MSLGVSDPGPGDHLPPWRSVLAVVAHPDDESFGLGAVLAGFVDAGAAVAVLCFTHGESSTLHGDEGDLASIRAGELAGAARVLGVDPVRLLDYPDGALAEVDVDDLSAHVLDLAGEVGADGLLVFDTDGVTGHDPGDIDLEVTVDRTRQLAAVACHPSQAVPGSLLWRRLDLLGDIENLRWLRPHPHHRKDPTSS